MLTDRDFECAASKLGVPLSITQTEALVTYETELKDWNDRVSLVSRRDGDRIRERHLLDCLSGAPLLPEGAISVLDLGTGAGLPGIPLQIIRPELRVDLLEPARMKVLFLKHVLEKLALDGLRVVRGRAPECPANGPYRVVTARAVAALPELWGFAEGYLEEGGELVAYKGPGALSEFGDRLPEGLHGEEAIVEVPHLGRARAIVRVRRQH